jgi:hypothetical protein
MGREVDHSPPSSAEVTSSWRGAQLKRLKDNFTFTFYRFYCHILRSTYLHINKIAVFRNIKMKFTGQFHFNSTLNTEL